MFKYEKQGEERLKKKFIQELWDNYKKYNMWVPEISKEKGRYKRKKVIFEGRLTKNNPKLSSDKTQIQGAENIKHNKWQKTHLCILYSNCRK